MTMSSGKTRAPIAIGIVADREITRLSLATLLGEYRELKLLGMESGTEDPSPLLAAAELRLLVVNMPLDYHGGRSPAIEYVRRVKQTRPEIRVLLLKRRDEAALMRASLEAGADGCCLSTTPPQRLVLAIKGVADGAAWLDPGISDVVLHGGTANSIESTDRRPPASSQLSPRERQVLKHLSEGCTNDEIAFAIKCSTATVKTHLGHVFRKLDVDDRVSAVVTALRYGLI